MKTKREKKRTTCYFNKAGKLRFIESNPRGKDADWIEFACSKEETDEIMQSIGLAMERTDNKETPAGTLLANICREWRLK